MSTSICDDCGEPSLLLTEMEGWLRVMVDPEIKRPTNAQIHAAPRRRERWCDRCIAALRKWQRSQQRRRAA